MKVLHNDRQAEPEEHMKTMYDALMLSAAVVMLLFAGFLLMLNIPANAYASESESDEHIESSSKNAAEKDLVTKYVRDVRGVNEVVNDMTVGETPAKTN
jgi:osmotically-inducible protein OsmY